MKEKKCSKCYKVKPLTDFYKGSKNKDGYRPICKECHSVSFKKYYSKNKDLLKDRRMANKDKKKAYNKEYSAKNKERIRIAEKKHYLANKEKISKRKAEWYKRKKEDKK